uniref:Uncharacterized protein n=1 Tax=Pithovirus LCPAC404 TaxID=2506597 RepID=A0A481ZDG5_9VIRU|nr:MAG: uncharacterized protein LCPAC404_02290 [Pithovirus LCPAC404]
MAERLKKNVNAFGIQISTEELKHLEGLPQLPHINIDLLSRVISHVKITERSLEFRSISLTAVRDALAENLRDISDKKEKPPVKQTLIENFISETNEHTLFPDAFKDQLEKINGDVLQYLNNAILYSKSLIDIAYSKLFSDRSIPRIAGRVKEYQADAVRYTKMYMTYRYEFTIEPRI